jgi:hypothetical protein
MSINLGAIIKTLTQIVPLSVALAFHAWQPTAARRLVKPLGLLS